MFDQRQYSEVKESARSLIETLSELVPREHRGGLTGTPDRITKMYEELLSGYDHIDGEVILNANFNDTNDNDLQGYDQMVIVKDIEYWSLCEHHLCPFFGKVHIGYVPNKKIVGLSKLPRLVEIYARRLQVQERMTRQIINDITTYIEPMGSMVVVEGRHSCCSMRGVKTPNATTITSACQGVMFDNPTARIEYMTLIQNWNK